MLTKLGFNRNYNSLVPKLMPKVLKLPVNSRARCNTGTHCNYRCSFCYYIKQLDKVTSFEVIEKRIAKLATLVDEIELSGGESSIHDDWFKILDTCRDYGFKNISTLSNGSKFADIKFTMDSKARGLDEILFSVHGVGPSHDKAVGVKGAFDKINRAIDNAEHVGIKVRLNCTVTEEFNGYDYAMYVLKTNAKQINLLPTNSWEDSKAKIDYSVINTRIFEFIDIINKYDPSRVINVRYIPLCFMKGYEKYVVGVYQHIFDTTDWNICMMDDSIFDLTETPDLAELYDQAHKVRRDTYIKPRKCTSCKYLLVCDGIEYNNLKQNTLEPYKGRVIQDVQYFTVKKYQNDL